MKIFEVLQKLWHKLQVEKGAFFCQNAWKGYLLLTTGWGHDGEQVCKISKPYVKDFENILGITKTLT
jgi:hypothetical protein